LRRWGKGGIHPSSLEFSSSARTNRIRGEFSTHIGGINEQKPIKVHMVLKSSLPPTEQTRKDKEVREQGVRLRELHNHPIAWWHHLKSAHQGMFSGT
jgi:hypothetical protein